MAKHNKKRNVGLIHEQLIRFASEKIVAKDKAGADVAISILDEHFAVGTELHKEFRLFNALIHTTISESSIAKRIIQESKAACKNHDAKKLRSEKSCLIKSINHKIDDKSVYSKRLAEYRVFATVQALLNEWRGGGKLSPVEIVKYETVLENWLTRAEEKVDLNKNDNANPLVLKIMIEKFNKKYAGELNEEQAKLLEYKLEANTPAIIAQIDKIKKAALQTLEEFCSSADNKVLNGKKDLVESNIQALEPSANDTSIIKALMLSKLIETIGE